MSKENIDSPKQEDHDEERQELARLRFKIALSSNPEVIKNLNKKYVALLKKYPFLNPFFVQEEPVTK